MLRSDCHLSAWMGVAMAAVWTKSWQDRQKPSLLYSFHTQNWPDNSCNNGQRNVCEGPGASEGARSSTQVLAVGWGKKSAGTVCVCSCSVYGRLSRWRLVGFYSDRRLAVFATMPQIQDFDQANANGEIKSLLCERTTQKRRDRQSKTRFLSLLQVAYCKIDSSTDVSLLCCLWCMW